MPDSPISRIFEDLKSLGDSYRKEKIAGYLKTSSLDFIGVELPDIHRTVKQNIKGLKIDELPALMDGLWKIRTFETRLAAIDVLKVYAKKGSVKTAMILADKWVEDGDTWGIIDPLCSPTIGSMILRDAMVDETLRTWRTSDNFWRRRASVLPFLHLALKSQYKPEFNDRIFEAVSPHISDKEFFVGKAAGWVLRELSKRDPDLVRKYYVENREQMTKLVIREGSKKL
ncbi:MAG: DNA alkylation repair protein [Candidatus Thorarchaeota archaeon]|nr:DNA alkylation repair protein [Candidatus Thorarchaeota archaeon]